MNRPFLLLAGRAVVITSLVLSSALALAAKPKPPMVASSSATPLSKEMVKLTVDAQKNVSIDAILVSTKDKIVDGKLHQILTNPNAGANQVTYTYKGNEEKLVGWDAVHFLVNGGYFKWQEGVGLMPTGRFQSYGGGTTQAVQGVSGITKVSKTASTGKAGTGTVGSGGSNVTQGSAGGGQAAGSGGSTGSSGKSTGGASGAKTGRGPVASPTQAVTGFSCDVVVAADTVLGGGISKSAKAQCIKDVAAKLAQCISLAQGDRSLENKCREKCDKVRAQKCAGIASDIEFENSESTSDSPFQ